MFKYLTKTILPFFYLAIIAVLIYIDNAFFINVRVMVLLSAHLDTQLVPDQILRLLCTEKRFEDRCKFSCGRCCDSAAKQQSRRKLLHCICTGTFIVALNRVFCRAYGSIPQSSRTRSPSIKKRQPNPGLALSASRNHL